MRTQYFNLARRGRVAILPVVFLAFAIFWTPVASSEPTPGPALWKVEGGRAELYLFGTFHLLPSGLEWQNETITKALAASTTLVLEANSSNENEIGALVQKYAFNPEGKTLRSYFTSEEADLIDAAMVPWGMSVDGAAALRPWFVSLQVGLTAIFSLGFDPDNSVEEVLLKTAREKAMSLEYLETSEVRIRAMADHPDQIQADILLSSIEDLARLEEMTGQMSDVWMRGDSAVSATVLNGPMERTPELAEAVLYQRNRNWIRPLRHLLASDGHYFVAVGTSHLVGRYNLLELLEAQGYTVVRQ